MMLDDRNLLLTAAPQRRRARPQRGRQRRAPCSAEIETRLRADRRLRGRSTSMTARPTVRRRALAELAASRPWLRIVPMRESCGQSAAVRSGVRHARAPIVATLDGDGQNDPAFLPQMLEALQKAGLAGRARPGPARRPQGHRLQEAAVAHRQRRARAHPQGRHARHRLRAEMLPPRGLSGVALFRRAAPLHAGADGARGLSRRACRRASTGRA